MTKHGGWQMPEYNTWVGIRRRCRDPSHKDYASYGGRGITVCEAWELSFAAFLVDMGRKPTRRHCIERRDNTKGYSPDNCYWATPKQQAENRRSNVHVILAGERVTITEAARRLGMHRTSIQYRAEYRGVTLQQAVDHYASQRGLQ